MSMCVGVGVVQRQPCMSTLHPQTLFFPFWLRHRHAPPFPGLPAILMAPFLTLRWCACATMLVPDIFDCFQGARCAL